MEDDDAWFAWLDGDDPPPELRWWMCSCGHRLYEHTPRTIPSTSGLTYGRCRECECREYVAETGQRFSRGELRP